MAAASLKLHLLPQSKFADFTLPKSFTPTGDSSAGDASQFLVRPRKSRRTAALQNLPVNQALLFSRRFFDERAYETGQKSEMRSPSAGLEGLRI